MTQNWRWSTSYLSANIGGRTMGRGAMAEICVAESVSPPERSPKSSSIVSMRQFGDVYWASRGADAWHEA